MPLFHTINVMWQHTGIENPILVANIVVYGVGRNEVK